MVLKHLYVYAYSQAMPKNVSRCHILSIVLKHLYFYACSQTVPKNVSRGCILSRVVKHMRDNVFFSVYNSREP